MYQPLADKIRPKTLDDVVGQQHLLGPNGLLRRVIESGNIPNLIFYGPSGVGKTTVASIIAKQTDRKLYHLNATTAGIADIKAIIDELDTFLAPNGALVYLDEIQYFNKKQQQSLLEFIELAPNLSGLAETRGDLTPGTIVSVYIKSILPQRMKIKLTVIDVLAPSAEPAPPPYFITDGHIGEWVYTPPCCDRKYIATVFE